VGDSVDLNSDLGEGAGPDAEIIPLVTSANIACGAHAGDEATMDATVRLALAHGVAVGAHPGYRDRESFGRLPLDIAPEQLAVDLRTQIEALASIAERAGARVTHVKAHGALYNQAERDPGVAATIARAAAAADPALVLLAPPGSALERAAEAAGLRVAREGFIDRAYEADGRLRSRRLPGALITDPVAAAAQAVSIVRDGNVRAHDGTLVPLEVDTLCVHGDTAGAPAILRAVRAAVVAEGVAIRALAR
jgi:UPF0271 protein